MSIVPFCECPLCHMTGLHLMPRVRSYTDRQPGLKAHIEEIPITATWYDDREDTGSKPMVRTTWETSIIETYVHEIVRECAFCHHEWFEEWKRRTL